MMTQEEKTNQLFNGDCLVELDKVKDKSVQLILIDPPYNIGKDEWDDYGITKKGYQENLFSLLPRIFCSIPKSFFE